ncbi:unnamed protein product [Polarella glacialis]|uniref:C3H1-type domain-containing protein n=1 Tax=Polarella glacialis TaxID=89957 RepID=A0A813IER4_POLGL|nr:unnamed protein product [Polarella glacialis]
MDEAKICASCPEALHDEVSQLCRQHGIQKAFGKAGDMVNSLSGKDWIPKWEAKVVMATVTKAQTLGASKALILCIAGGNHCDAEMARQPTLVRAIKAEMEDPAFRVRVEWLEIAEFVERYGQQPQQQRQQRQQQQQQQQASANGKGKGKEKSTAGKHTAVQSAAQQQPQQQPQASANANGKGKGKEKSTAGKSSPANNTSNNTSNNNHNKGHTPQISPAGGQAGTTKRHDSDQPQQPDVAPKPCKFFLEGGCKSGKACKFLHGAATTTNNNNNNKAKESTQASAASKPGKVAAALCKHFARHFALQPEQLRGSCTLAHTAGMEKQSCKSLAVAAADLSAQLAGQQRTTSACLQQVALLNPNWALAQDLLKAGQDYHSQRESGVAGKDLGSPHIYVWQALLPQFKHFPDLSAEEQTQLSSCEAMLTPQMALEHVHVCRASKTSDGSAVKLTIATDTSLQPLATIMFSILERRGANVVFGPAPPSGAERKVKRLLRQSGKETAARKPSADVKAKQSTHKMPCRECGKTFKDWHDVRSKHWLCKGREPLCICAQCDKAFEDDVSCAQHQSSTGHKGMARVNNGEDPTWECGQCKKTFATPEGCHQHQTMTGHGDTPCCSTCMKTFLDERSLLQHQKSTKHEGILWLMGDSESGSSSGSYAESGGEDMVSADEFICGCGRVFFSECAVSQHQDATGHLGRKCGRRL